ncbi:MAG: ArsR family transcriptional regulator [Methylacidiphilales bacterium]|nr:ArsR family transcriptional regulator [Candidatus Methylacidiphilales bacterium]NJR17925.1 ArsR family transcriptional regulator [Calothrix sp. CSU_2_0]
MSRLITPESPLLVPPLLAAEIGLEEALILQQIHYFCQISKHVKDDGRIWFWKTLNDWGETLPFLKMSKIRRAIANLKDKFQLIDIRRHSEKTWYQANWFTINVENVEALWNRICQNEQIDVIALNNSTCSKSTNHIKDYPSEENSPQQHGVDEEKVDWEKLAKEAEIWEQSANVPGQKILSGNFAQISHCVDKTDSLEESSTQCQEQSEINHYVNKTEQVNSTNAKDSNEGHFSEAGAEVEVDMTSDSPTKPEIREICTELKRLRINPDPCLGVVKKYWENVEGTISRVKEAVNEGWCNNPTGLFINSCKSGEKPKNTVDAGVKDWFESLRGERIAIAMSGGIVYTVDGEAVEIGEMMRRYPNKE